MTNNNTEPNGDQALCEACRILAAATYPDGSLKMSHAVAVGLAGPALSACTCGSGFAAQHDDAGRPT